MIKAILLDIDGTLTNDEKKITKKTKEALMNAQKKGIILVLASGRPTKGLYKYAKELEMDKYNGLLISFNGAVITNYETNEKLFEQVIEHSKAVEVLNHMKNFDVIPMIYKDDHIIVNDVYKNTVNSKVFGKINIIEYEARNTDYLLCEKKDLATNLDWDICKILVAGDPDYLHNSFEKMKKPFINKLNSMFTAEFYYEFTDLGVDKAHALNQVMPKLNIAKEEIIAFGDGQNDKTMIEYAGIGVAMENAIDELKAVAQFVTKSNQEDGIAYALEKYLK
ncbi:Cof-type HAD-IIB family hydrolase [Spiroplasma tabanidicola]|uniref:Cof-type HAD-IIB family hydrolase n=1 Tax=Spiroplasma tabanidicola TaxID=324079 RepID=A0A6I6C8V1_9MOLU|nr:Cof-type HAD-IIB family hydrolase [Spiroplasma tabanidicola]QGS51889.1 Cof-type HAD-IIB family hydrolase [Spiroplasma tabanidicola]